MPEGLVLTNHLHSFAGSETVAIEVAEQLYHLGYRVQLRANVVSPRVARAIHEAVDVSDVLDDLVWSRYDVIWSQHDLLSFSLTSELKAGARLVSAHLSPYHFREQLGVASGLLRGAIFVVNSEETASSLCPLLSSESTLFNFHNACPPAWFREGEVSEALQHLAIVSNHPPEEVIAAGRILRRMGIKVTIFGKRFNYRRLAPRDLLPVDAVLTIGKTVQYALASSRPVFVYDHFGGPGWLDLSNFERAEQLNFSGRCTPQARTEEELVHSLTIGYASAVRDLKAIRLQVLERYDLQSFLLKLIENGVSPVSGGKPHDRSAKLLEYYARLSRSDYRRSHWRNVLNWRLHRLGSKIAF